MINSRESIKVDTMKYERQLLLPAPVSESYSHMMTNEQFKYLKEKAIMENCKAYLKSYFEKTHIPEQTIEAIKNSSHRKIREEFVQHVWDEMKIQLNEYKEINTVSNFVMLDEMYAIELLVLFNVPSIQL